MHQKVILNADLEFKQSEINRLKDVSLTPLELLDAILRAKLKDGITDAEVEQICAVYLDHKTVCHDVHVSGGKVCE